MGTFEIIVISGLVIISGLVMWRKIYLRKKEKQAKKLMEDFISKISILFSTINFSKDDTRPAKLIAIASRRLLWNKTSWDFNNIIVKIRVMPQIGFKFVDIKNPVDQSVRVATNNFTIKVVPLLKDVCKYALEHKGKNRGEMIAPSSNRFYNGVEQIIFDFLSQNQTKTN